MSRSFIFLLRMKAKRNAWMGKHIEHMEQDKNCYWERTCRTIKGTRQQKNPSFAKALLTTLLVNKNTTGCSESPEFLLLVLFSRLLLAILFLQ